jgi:hypothetical protein
MPPGNPPAPPKVTSLTDPTAAWTNKGQRKVGFAHGANYLIDLGQAIIVDVEATPARWSAEVAATKTVLERTACPALTPARSPPPLRPLQQLGHFHWAFCRDHTKLRGIAPDCIDHGRALLDQQIAHPQRHQLRLALGAFDRHKAHPRPAHRLTDRLGVVYIILAALDVPVVMGSVGWKCDDPVYPDVMPRPEQQPFTA